MNRRQFGGAAIATIAFGGLLQRVQASNLPSYRNEVQGLGQLRQDPTGLLDLPKGFSYRVISHEGDRMDDGFYAPGKFDGMAPFILDRSRIALVRNHEIDPKDRALGAARDDFMLEEKLRKLPHFGKDRDGFVMPGGTSTMIYNWQREKVESQFLSLAGTTYNCSGGTTPWGSWLSCEETVMQADEVERPHGWVFEVPARGMGLATPVPLSGLGRFRHESATVDPQSGIVYLTEDRPDGLFYRFIPDTRGVLAEGGRLQALVMSDWSAGDTRNWETPGFAKGRDYRVHWIDMDGTHNPDDDLRARGHARGAALFARGEGVYAGKDVTGQSQIHFACTSGGSAQIGQIMRYTPSRAEGSSAEQQEPAKLRLFVESADSQLLDYADNITLAPWGDLIICEDRSGHRTNHVRGITPRGEIYTIARLNEPTEFAGLCFAPDGKTMFVNLQDPGRTIAISGPMMRLARVKHG
jgi:secreted PhoX family phosphatase